MKLSKSLSAIAALVVVAASAEAKTKSLREQHHFSTHGGEKELDCWKNPNREGCADAYVGWKEEDMEEPPIPKMATLERELEKEPMEPNSAYLCVCINGHC